MTPRTTPAGTGAAAAGTGAACAAAGAGAELSAGAAGARAAARAFLEASLASCPATQGNTSEHVRLLPPACSLPSEVATAGSMEQSGKREPWAVRRVAREHAAASAGPAPGTQTRLCTLRVLALLVQRNLLQQALRVQLRRGANDRAAPARGRRPRLVRHLRRMQLRQRGRLRDRDRCARRRCARAPPCSNDTRLAWRTASSCEGARCLVMRRHAASGQVKRHRLLA